MVRPPPLEFKFMKKGKIVPAIGLFQGKFRCNILETIVA